MNLSDRYRILRYSIGRNKLHKRQLDYINWFYNERPRLFQFKDRHRGEDCFIIGNGPSLNRMNLELLNDYYTFGLNKIYLIFDRVDLHITYHVSVNSLVIEQIEDQIHRLNCPKFFSYSNASRHSNLYDTYYLYTIGGVGNFQPDISCPVIEGGTVTYVAMQIAFYMGFKNVFLIGVDHNFAQTGSANEEQVMTGQDVNHFDPNYFSGQKWNLADLKSSEFGYSTAKLNYEYTERKIIDATVDGKLEVFDKMDFTEALKVAKKRQHKA